MSCRFRTRLKRSLSGPLADGLMERLRSGATSLKDALGPWLIPRHASQFDNAIRAGKILLWIRLADEDDEPRACQSLLAHSSDLVGVHDLVAAKCLTRFRQVAFPGGTSAQFARPSICSRSKGD